MPLLFKLVWEEKAGPKVRKLRGLVQIYHDNGLPGAPLTIKLNASVLLRWLGISTISGYLLAAGGLSLWLDQNPYNKIRFIDLLLPWHWSDLRSLRAAGYLEEGRGDLRAGRLPLGIMKLNAGLARFPQNLTARLELARLYAQFRNYRLLRAVLLGGLGEQPPPPSYLAALFDYAALMDDTGLVLAACNHSLRLARLPATTRTMVLAKKAETLLALQRFADALALLDQPDFQDYFRGAELRVLALCGLNRAPEAVGFARHWRQTHPDAPEYGLQIISTASRKNGQLDAMEQALRELARRQPINPEIQAFVVSEFWLAGRHDQALTALRDSVNIFSNTPALLALAAQRFAILLSPELIQICFAEAKELNLPQTAGILVTLIQTQLRRGDVPGVEHSFAEYLGLRSRPPAAQDEYFRNWLRILVDVIRHGTPEKEEKLALLIRQVGLSLPVYQTSLDALATTQRWSAMQTVAEAGLTAYTHSTSLRNSRDLAGQKLKEIAQAAPRLTPPRPLPKPVVAAPLPAAPAAPPITAEAFTSQITELMTGRKWAAAADLLRQTRRAAPAWLSSAADDLDWREIRLNFELGNKLETAYLVGQRLRYRKTESIRALELAREAEQRGDRDSARIIGHRILEEVPDFPAARRFLEKLEAPPPKKS